MSLFDDVHDHFFERRFGLDADSRRHLAHIAREEGVGEDEVRAILSCRILPGQSFGGARLDDLPRFARRVLFVQGDRGVTLRVSRPPFDEAGHIEVAVLDVESPQVEGT